VNHCAPFLHSKELSMPRILLSLLLLSLLAPPASAQKVLAPTQPAPPAPPVPVVAVSVPASPLPPHRALKYSLLPEDIDLVPGNAGPQWVRAGQAAAVVKIGLKESNWAGTETPLDKLPGEEVRKLLDGAHTALRLADQAARYDRCDWEYPPLTIQNLDLPLSEIQHLRTLATLLAIRCRLELSEGKFDRAVYTLQTGLALGRQVADAPLLIQNLVGVAITAIMLGRVEEWLTLPGSPDLFWPLTALPQPLVDSRRAMRHEGGTLFRSFPQLRRLSRETLTAAEAEHLADELLRTLGSLTGEKAVPAWEGKLAMATLAARAYPEAKRYLIARGRTSEQVAAMPSLQVVLIYYADQYDDTWDDILKWQSLPYWQSQPGLGQAAAKIRAARTTELNLFIALLMPAIQKVNEANARVQRQAAGLRCAAAIRLHASLHGGRLPTTLKEITEVPLPFDPATGKGFDEMYKAGDGKAVLDVPVPQGYPAPAGRRYEFVSPRKD
jgi:hypothetical protein